MLSLPKDLRVFFPPSVLVRWLTTACNLSCRGPNNLLWPLDTLPSRGGCDRLPGCFQRAGPFEDCLEVVSVKRASGAAAVEVPRTDKVRITTISWTLGAEPLHNISIQTLGIKSIKSGCRAGLEN